MPVYRFGPFRLDPVRRLLAKGHVGLGQTNQALEWLNRAADERSNWIIFLNVDPVFDPLRDEPEFRKFSERLKGETKG